MRCNHCGYENNDNFTFCPQCSKETEQQCATENSTVSDAIAGTEMPQFTVNPAAEHVLKALKDKLFLTICILFTVSTALTVFSGSFNVINILLTIFLWLTYSQAQKDNADAEHLRFISGTVYALYVIFFVAAVLFVLCGLIFIFIGGAFSYNTASLNEIFSEMNITLNISGIPLDLLPTHYYVVLFGVIFIIGGLITTILNILGIGSIHKFIRSVYRSINAGQILVEKNVAAQKWLMVFGILEAIECISSLSNQTSLALYSGIAMASALIVCSVLVKKHFCNKD